MSITAKDDTLKSGSNQQGKVSAFVWIISAASKLKAWKGLDTVKFWIKKIKTTKNISWIFLFLGYRDFLDGAAGRNVAKDFRKKADVGYYIWDYTLFL